MGTTIGCKPIEQSVRVQSAEEDSASKQSRLHSDGRDPIDVKTGEHLMVDGSIPPRFNDLSTPSVALMPTAELWSLIGNCSGETLIALKPPSSARGFFRGNVQIDKGQVENIKKTLLSKYEGLKEIPADPENPSAIRAPVLSNGAQLPMFAATIADQETLESLRAHPQVDYVEPLCVQFFDVNSTACGPDTYVPSSNTRAKDESRSSVMSAPHDDLVPYPYRHHSVQDAWGRASLPGNGVTIAVLDTGVSTLQEQFFARFSSSSFPRPPHVRLNESIESIDDTCFHGTKVASIAAAPLDGRSIVGIAWGAPLVTVKIAHAPVHGTQPGPAFMGAVTSVGAICNGIKDAVDNKARVIGMAFGMLYTSPSVRECISNAFDGNPDMIFVAAAGSSVSQVVFPANMDREVLAVSMVQIPDSGTGYRMFSVPLTVSYGPEVDFVSVMASNGIPASGVVGNATRDDLAAFKWSSAATGIYSGLIAIAIPEGWPSNLSRAQFISRLRSASNLAEIRDVSGEAPRALLGAGILNAYLAHGGSTRLVIGGPYEAEAGKPFTMVAEGDGFAPLNFAWGMPLTGTTTQSVVVRPQALPDRP